MLESPGNFLIFVCTMRLAIGELLRYHDTYDGTLIPKSIHRMVLRWSLHGINRTWGDSSKSLKGFVDIDDLQHGMAFIWHALLFRI